jgi:hypothetical protein
MRSLHVGPRDFANRACANRDYSVVVAAAMARQGHSGHFPNPFVSQT